MKSVSDGSSWCRRRDQTLQGIATFLTELCIACIPGTTLITELHETEPILNSGPTYSVPAHLRSDDVVHPSAAGVKPTSITLVLDLKRKAASPPVSELNLSVHTGQLALLRQKVIAIGR